MRILHPDRGPNTLVEYFWRAPNRHKETAGFVLVGAITQDQVDAVEATLVDGVGFDPEVLGLDDLSDTTDGPWLHEILGFQHTASPAEAWTVDEFVTAMTTAQWPPDPREVSHQGVWSTVMLAVPSGYQTTLRHIVDTLDPVVWIAASDGITPEARHLGAVPESWPTPPRQPELAHPLTREQLALTATLSPAQAELLRTLYEAAQQVYLRLSTPQARAAWRDLLLHTGEADRSTVGGLALKRVLNEADEKKSTR